MTKSGRININAFLRGQSKSKSVKSVILIYFLSKIFSKIQNIINKLIFFTVFTLSTYIITKIFLLEIQKYDPQSNVGNSFQVRSSLRNDSNL